MSGDDSYNSFMRGVKKINLAEFFEQEELISVLNDLYNGRGNHDIYIIYGLIEHNINIVHSDIANTPANKEFIIKIDGTMTLEDIIYTIIQIYNVSLIYHYETRSCFFEGVTERSREELYEKYIDLRRKYNANKQFNEKYSDETFLKIQTETAHRLDMPDAKFTAIANQWSFDFFNEIQDDSSTAKFYSMDWGS